MLTFILTCVTCTSYVTSLGLGVWGMNQLLTQCGDYLSLPSHALSLDEIQRPCQPKVDAKHPGVAVALDELQDEKSYGGHRSSLERPCSNVNWKKKTQRVFRNKFPVIYRLSFKKHFKIPGNFGPILGHESVVSLWRKRHFLKEPSNRWRGFPPDGMFIISHGGLDFFSESKHSNLGTFERNLVTLRSLKPSPGLLFG